MLSLTALQLQRCEMESALLNVRIVPFSPTQRFSPRVDPLRVTSLSVSRTQSLTPTPSLHRFTQIQKFLRSKEPLSLPIGSPKSSSNDAFESETKIEDDKYSSNINLKPSGMISNPNFSQYMDLYASLLIFGSILGIQEEDWFKMRHRLVWLPSQASFW